EELSVSQPDFDESLADGWPAWPAKNGPVEVENCRDAGHGADDRRSLGPRHVRRMHFCPGVQGGKHPTTRYSTAGRFVVRTRRRDRWGEPAPSQDSSAAGGGTPSLPRSGYILQELTTSVKQLLPIADIVNSDGSAPIERHCRDRRQWLFLGCGR